MRHLIAALPLLALLLAGAAPVAQAGENDWSEGNLVYLRAGTQIWVAPSLGSCYHTIVPENDWAVKVTGGPRIADGRTWYDTSRAAAGDPNGGTGWVNVEQVDTPGFPRDPGRYCPPGSAGGPPAEGVCAGKRFIPQVLYDMKLWWMGQELWMKVGVLGLALGLLLFGNKLSGASSTLAGFVRAAAAGVLVAGLADLTRTYWLDVWQQVAGGVCGIDPSILLLVLPLVVWALRLLATGVSLVIAIISSLISLLFLLPMLAPDRFGGLTDIFSGLLGGGGGLPFP